VFQMQIKNTYHAFNKEFTSENRGEGNLEGD
jgi:hypothetical protein